MLDTLLGICFGAAVAKADTESTRNSHTHSVGRYPLQLGHGDGKSNMGDSRTLQGDHDAVQSFRDGLHGRGTKAQTKQAIEGNW